MTSFREKPHRNCFTAPVCRPLVLPTVINHNLSDFIQLRAVLEPNFENHSDPNENFLQRERNTRKLKTENARESENKSLDCCTFTLPFHRRRCRKSGMRKWLAAHVQLQVLGVRCFECLFVEPSALCCRREKSTKPWISGKSCHGHAHGARSIGVQKYARSCFKITSTSQRVIQAGRCRWFFLFLVVVFTPNSKLSDEKDGKKEEIFKFPKQWLDWLVRENFWSKSEPKQT